MKKIFLSFFMCVLFTSSALAALSDSDFIELCKKGSIQEIIEAIENGANVNAKNKDEFTPLMMAAIFNPDPEVYLTLIKAGADKEVKNKLGYSANDYAFKNERIFNYAVIKAIPEAKRKTELIVNFFELCEKGSLKEINEAKIGRASCRERV